MQRERQKDPNFHDESQLAEPGVAPDKCANSETQSPRVYEYYPEDRRHGPDAERIWETIGIVEHPVWIDHTIKKLWEETLRLYFPDWPEDEPDWFILVGRMTRGTVCSWAAGRRRNPYLMASQAMTRKGRPALRALFIEIAARNVTEAKSAVVGATREQRERARMAEAMKMSIELGRPHSYTAKHIAKRIESSESRTHRVHSEGLRQYGRDIADNLRLFIDVLVQESGATEDAGRVALAALRQAGEDREGEEAYLEWLQEYLPKILAAVPRDDRREVARGFMSRFKGLGYLVLHYDV